MIVFRIFFILLLFSLNQAKALIEVDITRGNLNPLPVAVSPLFSEDETNKKINDKIKINNLGEEISIVIENNLRATGLFNPLDKKAFLQASAAEYFSK